MMDDRDNSDKTLLDEIETIQNKFAAEFYDTARADSERGSLAVFYMGMIMGTVLRREKSS